MGCPPGRRILKTAIQLDRRLSERGTPHPLPYRAYPPHHSPPTLQTYKISGVWIGVSLGGGGPSACSSGDGWITPVGIDQPSRRPSAVTRPT